MQTHLRIIPVTPALSDAPERPAPAPAEGTCPICRGHGWLVKNVAPGHPDFGRVFPCPCKRQELAERAQRTFMERSGLKRRFLDMTFDRFAPEQAKGSPAERQALAETKALCERYAQDPQGFLTLLGPYGTGKTHLAAAITNAILARGEQAIFVVVPEMLDWLRESYADTNQDYEKRIQLLRECPLLVLDDLGTERMNEWTCEQIFKIINWRYNDKLPLVITSNATLRPDDTRLDPRIRSRILHGARREDGFCRVRVIAAGDYRPDAQED